MVISPLLSKGRLGGVSIIYTKPLLKANSRSLRLTYCWSLVRKGFLIPPLIIEYLHQNRTTRQFCVLHIGNGLKITFVLL